MPGDQDSTSYLQHGLERPSNGALVLCSSRGVTRKLHNESNEPQITASEPGEQEVRICRVPRDAESGLEGQADTSPALAS